MRRIFRKYKLPIILGAAGLVVAVTALLIWLFGYHIPYANAENTMDPKGILIITEQEDGTLAVEWPTGKNADRYVLELIKVHQKEETVLFRYETEEERRCVLPELPEEETVIVRVRCNKTYSGGIRWGTKALQARFFPAPPTVIDPKWTVDVQNEKLTIAFRLEEGDVCKLYTAREGESPTFLQEVEGNSVTLDFGEDGVIPVPEYGFERLFFFEVSRTINNTVFTSNVRPTLTLIREDFLGTGLLVECQELTDNAYKLTWNETKGDHYEIQYSENGVVWNTLGTVAGSQEREFITPNLPAYSTFRLRLLAVGGQTLPGSEYAAEPAVLEVNTRQRVHYSTVWPVQNLEVYGDPEKSVKLGDVLSGTALCVLEETENGLFAVRYQNDTGYVDSRYCMINLPDYMGSLCSYDITNSYRSIFLVHEYAVPEVSGMVLWGYENVHQASDTYLVPLLYPTAKKLLQAAEAAREQGYILEVRDAFRPNAATVDITAKGKKLLKEAVPQYTYNGKPVTDLDQLDFADARQEWAEATVPTTEATEPTATGATDPTATTGATEATTAPTEPTLDLTEMDLTYEVLMTNNGKWKVSDFLDEGSSTHNQGLALDIVLLDKDGKELAAQTSIHDLSWYSSVARNNQNANILRKLMTEAGFAGVDAKWWHFQDIETRGTVKPQSLYWGVNLKGWTYDGMGWRYRDETGSFYRAISRNIDGTAYEFDSNGYVIEPEKTEQ